MNNSKKIICISLLLIFLISMLSGCIQPEIPQAPKGKEEELEVTTPMDESLLEDLPEPGTLEKIDLDNDGTDDKFVYAFDEEEIEKNVFLKQTIEYETIEKGMKGTIKLEFENKGDKKTISYTYEIPKEFAKHVNELEFSIPPTKIIEEDPLMNWELELAESLEAKIPHIIIAQGFIDFAQGIKPGSSALGTALQGFEGFKFIGELRKCSKITEKSARAECRIYLFARYGSFLRKEQCDKMQGVEKSICEAIVFNDYTKCREAGVYADDDKATEGCIKIFFAHLVNSQCKGLSGIERDQCMMKAALMSRYKGACNLVQNDIMKNMCFAGFNQNPVYCKELKDQAMRKICCDLMVDAEIKEECMTDYEEPEIIPEEQDDQDEFRESSTECPYPIPKEATLVDSPYGGYYIERWKLPDGKSVGPYKTFHDKEKTKPRSLTCYNDVGQKDGQNIEWDKEGNKKFERNYQKDEAHGESLRYSHGKLVEENNFQLGKLDGEHKKWHEDGTLYNEGSYLEGEKNGIWITYYGDGTKQDQTEIGTGNQTTWHEDGSKKLVSTGNYDSGKFTGTITTWPIPGRSGTECQVADGEYLKCKTV